MIKTSFDNPAISPLLRWITGFESAVVLVSGVGLFFLPTLLGPLWPWQLAPFNTRFMGAIYLASFMSAVMLAWKGRWSPTRVIVPMIFIFTTVVLLVSLAYLDRFLANSPSTLLWFILYVGIPVNCALHLWLYRRLPPADSVPVPSFLRGLLLVQSVVIGIYGLGLLAAPVAFGSFWPWGLDEFHARMYSVAFLTPALGSLLLFRKGSSVELGALGWTQLVGGVFPILGLVIVDSAVQRVNWSQAGTWLWIIMFAFIGVVGLALIVYQHRLRSAEVSVVF